MSVEACRPSGSSRTAGIHNFEHAVAGERCRCGAVTWEGDGNSRLKWDQAAYVAYAGVELGPPSISDVAVNIEDALMCLTPGLNTTEDPQLRALLTIARGHLLAALAYAKKEAA